MNRAALVRRLDAAIDGVYEHHGLRGDPAISADLLRAALTDVGQVVVDALTEEFGGDKQEVREPLPKEPGSLILGYVIADRRYPKGVILRQNYADSWGPIDESTFHGYPQFEERDITAWAPARVLPAASVYQASAELAAIADASRFDSYEPLENVVSDLRERAAIAAKVLDGEVP